MSDACLPELWANSKLAVSVTLLNRSTTRRAGVGAVLLSAASLTATQGLGALLSFTASSLAARALGATNFGAYTFATANALMFAIILDVRGLQWTNAIDAARGVPPAGLWARSFRSLAIALALSAGLYLVGAAFGLREHWEILLLAVPALSLAQLQACYQGLQNFRAFNGQTIAKLGIILLASSFAFLLPSPYRLPYLLIAWPLAHILVSFSASLRLRRDHESHRHDPVSPLTAPVRFRAWLVNIASIAAGRIELLVVHQALNAALLGIYAVVFVLSDLMARAAGSFGTALLPWVVRESDGKARCLGSSIVMLVSVGVMTFGGGALILFGRPAITLLYGSSYADAYRIAVLHVPGLILLASVTVLNNVVAAEGYPVTQILAAILGIAAKVLTLRVTIASLGLMATPLALAIGSGVWLLALIILSSTARDIVVRVPEAFVTILRVIQRRLSVPGRLRGVQ